MTSGLALVVGIAIGALLVALTLAGRHRPDTAPSPSAGSAGGESATTGADERAYEGAFDVLPIGVVLFSSTGEVVARNRAASVAGGRHRQVLVDEALDRVFSQVSGAGERDEQRLQLAGMNPVTLVITGVALVDGGVLVTVQDVTESDRLAAMRTDFVANLSHELKTPVGALAVLAEAIAGSVDDDDDAEVLGRLSERMVYEAHRVSATIDELLELSLTELDGVTRRHPVEVDRVIEAALDRVRGFADSRNIVLGYDLEDHRAVVYGEPRQLASALGNLLENAVKYSEPGGSVELVVEAYDEVIDFKVVDHGIGIPARDLDRIFERFYRVDRARSRDTGGAGLGLAIVRHVATNHDGTVSVTSEEGKGSVFSLRIPTGHLGPTRSDTADSSRRDDAMRAADAHLAFEEC